MLLNRMTEFRHRQLGIAVLCCSWRRAIVAESSLESSRAAQRSLTLILDALVECSRHALKSSFPTRSLAFQPCIKLHLPIVVMHFLSEQSCGSSVAN